MNRRRGTPSSSVFWGSAEEMLRGGGDGFGPGLLGPLRCRDPGFLWVRLAASFVNSRCRGGKQEEPRGGGGGGGRRASDGDVAGGGVSEAERERERKAGGALVVSHDPLEGDRVVFCSRACTRVVE